jgi:hypothetical protein
MTEQQEGFDSQGIPEDATGIVFASPVPPSGDLIDRIANFMAENMKPSTAIFHDPISGAQALGIVANNRVEPIDPSFFDGYLTQPRTREGTASVTNLDSFIDHTNRFKGPDSIIFADDNRTSPKLTSVLDYNPSGPPGRTPADFGQHRAVYAFPLSDEWKAWTKVNKNQMNMVQFAEFLEDRIIDVLAPGDTVLEGDQLKMVEHARRPGPSRLAVAADRAFARPSGLRERRHQREPQALQRRGRDHLPSRAHGRAGQAAHRADVLPHRHPGLPQGRRVSGARAPALPGEAEPRLLLRVVADGSRLRSRFRRGGWRGGAEDRASGAVRRSGDGRGVK